MKRAILGALAVLSIVGATATPGYAQPSRGDIAGGWQYLHTFESEDEDVNFAKGFFVEGTGNITPMFSVVGEYAASFKNLEESLVESGVPVSASADLTLQTFMGGVRVGTPGRLVRPFAQVLLGGVRGSADVTFQAAGVSESDSDSQTEFGFQLGGGVDVSAGGGIGVRAKVNYLLATGDMEGNAIRFSVGIVVPF